MKLRQLPQLFLNKMNPYDWDSSTRSWPRSTKDWWMRKPKLNLLAYMYLVLIKSEFSVHRTSPVLGGGAKNGLHCLLCGKGDLYWYFFFKKKYQMQIYKGSAKLMTSCSRRPVFWGGYSLGGLRVGGFYTCCAESRRRFVTPRDQVSLLIRFSPTPSSWFALATGGRGFKLM